MLIDPLQHHCWVKGGPSDSPGWGGSHRDPDLYERVLGQPIAARRDLGQRAHHRPAGNGARHKPPGRRAPQTQAALIGGVIPLSRAASTRVQTPPADPQHGRSTRNNPPRHRPPPTPQQEDRQRYPEQPTTTVREGSHTVRLLSVPMARRPTLESQLCAYLAPGETWPEGQLVDDAPAAAHFARRLVLQLQQECKIASNLSMHAIAKQADVNPQTVANLLSGNTWGEIPTIFQLETAIKQEHWTHDHLGGDADETSTDPRVHSCVELGASDEAARRHRTLGGRRSGRSRCWLYGVNGSNRSVEEPHALLGLDRGDVCPATLVDADAPMPRWGWKGSAELVNARTHRQLAGEDQPLAVVKAFGAGPRHPEPSAGGVYRWNPPRHRRERALWGARE